MPTVSGQPSVSSTPFTVSGWVGHRSIESIMVSPSESYAGLASYMVSGQPSSSWNLLYTSRANGHWSAISFTPS